MKKIVTSLLCGLIGINAVMASQSGRPRLVVGIVVDQLRTDYMEYLQNLFGEKGFRRLMRQGVYLKDVDFKASPLDAVSATAMIYTGTYPNANGVTGAVVRSSTERTLTPSLYDKSVMGNFSSDQYSPSALRVSTISDEIEVDGAGVGAIYAITTDPGQAVIMAGHAGDGAFWLSPENGKWATSSYYKDVPSVMTARNYSQSVSSKLDTMQWRPSLPLEKYPGLPAQKKYYPFRHTFPTSEKDVYRKFAGSALSNREITDVAIDYIEKLKLGNRGETIDMLSLTYTAAPFKYAKDGDYRVELEDTYVRLDSQLARLLEAIDKNVGADNVFLFLTGTGYYDDAAPYDAKYRIPGGEFSVKRAVSLLNSFLAAKFGNGNYVDTYYDGQIYLDRKSITSAGLDLDEVAALSRDFLGRMLGVSQVRTTSDILEGKSETDRSLRLIYDPVHGGDLYMLFSPGWTVTDDLRYPQVSKNVRNGIFTTPAFFFGGDLPAVTIGEAVDAIRIAPTVTQRLRIRSPNGSQGRPLTF